MQPRAKLLATLLLGASAGVVAQYFLDPRMGRRRRARVMDKTAHWNAQLKRNIPKVLSDFRHQFQGVVAETKHMLEKDSPPSDRVLEERVHAALGRVVSHPGAIHVMAEDGHVKLSGPILASEIPKLLARVSEISGVKHVKNLLEAHQSAENVSALQGGQLRKEVPGYRQENWTPSLRVVAGGVGVGLVALGISQRERRLAWLSGLLGVALTSRAVTNLPLKRLTGLGAGRRAVDIQKTLHLKAPLQDVYRFFSEQENFPKYMASVTSVEKDYDGKSYHWELAGRLGIPVRWDAMLTSVVPDKLIAWKSLPGSFIRHSGVLHFEPEGAFHTRVQIQLHYNPPLGALGHWVGKVFGFDAKHWLDDEMVRVKMFLETGVKSHDVALTA